MNELMLERNSELFRAICKWRCMTTADLKKLVAEDETYSGFRQRIIRLERGGLLKSILYKGFNKIVYPSNELIHKLGMSGFNDENVRHDSVVSAIASEFYKYKVVKDIQLPHEYKTKSTWKHHAIEPDAIVTVEKNGQRNYLALEVELWRKDKKRIFDKFADYAKANEYSYVLYFLPSLPAFNSYKSRIAEFMECQDFKFLSSDIFEKMVFVYNPSLSKRLQDLGDSETIYKDKVIRVDDLLGEKNDS